MKHSPKNWALVISIQLGIIIGSFNLPNNIVNGATWYAPIIDFGRIASLFGIPVCDTALTLRLLSIGRRKKEHLKQFIDESNHAKYELIDPIHFISLTSKQMDSIKLAFRHSRDDSVLDNNLPFQSLQRHIHRKMLNFKKLSLSALVLAIATSSTSCSSGAIFGVTSWETLNAGQVAAVYHGSGADKDKVDIYSGKFNYGAFDKVLIYSTGQQLVDYSSRTDQGTPIDQSIHFAAQNIKGKINVQVIIAFEPTQESIGTVAKVLRVDEGHFKNQNLYASTQNAIIQVSAGLDPATYNVNLATVAEKTKESLQKEYGKMVRIQEVRITGIADFGEAFSQQLAEQSALKAATANEASKRKLIEAKKATLEAEAINIKAIDPVVREYQLKVKRLEIEATLAGKGISPYATGVTLSPSSSK
jgi:hypothetical protein